MFVKPGGCTMVICAVPGPFAGIAIAEEREVADAVKGAGAAATLGFELVKVTEPVTPGRKDSDCSGSNVTGSKT